MRLGGHQNLPGRCAEEKNLLSLPGIDEMFKMQVLILITLYFTLYIPDLKKSFCMIGRFNETREVDLSFV
jgi:hypothetical protein